MDRLSPNCIAGASSPYKVLSFPVPAQALALSFRLFVWESHCKAKLEGASIFTLKNDFAPVSQGLGFQVAPDWVKL